MPARSCAAAAATALLLVPAAAIAKPPPRETATPDQLRTYVSSGAYLRDVQTAIAPARAYLQQRLDQIAAQRSACTQTHDGAQSAQATPSAVLTLRRDAGLRVTATGAALKGRRATLDVARGVISKASARVDTSAALTLRHGARRVVLRSVRIRLGTTVSVTASVAGRRHVVLVSARGAHKPAVSDAARVSAARLRATAALARLGLGRTRTVALLSASVPAQPAFVPSPEKCAAIPAKPALVLDIDETALSAYLGSGGDPGGGTEGQAPELFGTAVALPPTLDLYRYAISRGVAVDFITARVAPQAVDTGSNLDHEGYTQRIGITFRTTPNQDAGQYKHDARAALQQQGYTILENVGDQCSDLYDGEAERSFKLPNTFYYTAGKQDAGCDPDS